MAWLHLSLDCLHRTQDFFLESGIIQSEKLLNSDNAWKIFWSESWFNVLSTKSAEFGWVRKSVFRDDEYCWTLTFKQLIFQRLFLIARIKTRVRYLDADDAEVLLLDVV